MLDKLSEKVLQYAISQYKPYLETLTLDEDTADELGTDLVRLCAACEYMCKNEYLQIVRKSPQTEDIVITLTHKGFSYFEYKQINMQIQKSNKFHQRANTVIGIVALLIAIAALFVSIMQLFQ